MTTTLPASSRSDGPAAAPVPAVTAVPAVPARPTGRRWALAGVGAALAGGVGIVASGTMGAVYDPAISGDAAAVAREVADSTVPLLVFHTGTMLATVLLVVFAAGLHRHLAAALPAGSLVPGVAAGGLGLTAVAGLLGAGLTTEFLFAPADGSAVAESAVFFSHWVGTIPWLWVGTGLAALGVAVAALRHGAAPRWLGWASVVLGVLTLLLGVSPLQYVAGMTGPVWLLLASAALARSPR